MTHRLVCGFCDRATEKPAGEASGFGRLVGTVDGKPVDIVYCSEHADSGWRKVSRLMRRAANARTHFTGHAARSEPVAGNG